MKRLLLFAVIIGAILIFLLANASGQYAGDENNYTLLIALNAIIIFVLLGVIGIQVWHLRKRIRDKVFGVKLALRLILMFAFIGVVPGLVVYTMSVQFVTKSIDTWFDVKIDNALARSQNLGQTVLAQLQKELQQKTASSAILIANIPRHELKNALNEIRAQAGVAQAALYQLDGSLLYSSQASNIPADKMLDPTLLQKLKGYSAGNRIENLGNQSLQLSSTAIVYPFDINTDTLYLQLNNRVPAQVSQDAFLVENVRKDYQGLAANKHKIKLFYNATLTLTLMMAMLAALALGFILSDRLSAPLGVLAAGTRAVAQGDFSQRQPVFSRDELGSLTHSFNRMTRQLADTRYALEEHQAKTEAAKAYLESLLNHLSSGVFTLDAELRLRSINPAANHILQFDPHQLLGISCSQWEVNHTHLEPIARAIIHHQQTGHDWQEQVEYQSPQGDLKILLMRGTQLAPVEAGFVIVFDDISRLLSAQRAAAWGEVAKRLAHEIRNPLTPIQLSAERLEMKLTPKLTTQDADFLSRGTSTIITQVAALKQMVDEFKDYARQSTILSPLHFNQLVREVSGLYESYPYIKIQLAESVETLTIQGDATRLRQVIHNLIKNAQEAIQGHSKPEVRVQTKYDNGKLICTVQDNGQGFSEEMLSQLFEPYVTSKPKGTGLGLAIIKKIIEEHNGSIRVYNQQPCGAVIQFELPAAKDKNHA